MSDKKFYLSKEQIAPLIPGMGGCLATDRITVDGQKVGYMYRDEPHNPLDSGWCFFAGDEDEAYTNNPENVAVYDVNTIANYDPDIMPFLHEGAGSRFERDENGCFRRLADDE